MRSTNEHVTYNLFSNKNILRIFLFEKYVKYSETYVFIKVNRTWDINFILLLYFKIQETQNIRSYNLTLCKMSVAKRSIVYINQIILYTIIQRLPAAHKSQLFSSIKNRVNDKMYVIKNFRRFLVDCHKSINF